MRTWAKYIVCAICLLIVGVLLAIGFMTAFLAPSIRSFALTSSADAAAWFQAVGSMIAIGGAFLVGRRQAEAAHKSALDLEEMRGRHRERGAESLQQRLLSTCEQAIDRMSRSSSAQSFTIEWEDSFGPTFRAAIHAFDNMPLFEVCRPDRIELALRIREIAGEISGMGERACLPPQPAMFEQDGWLHMTRAHRRFANRVQRLRSDFDRGAA